MGIHAGEVRQAWLVSDVQKRAALTNFHGGRVLVVNEEEFLACESALPRGVKGIAERYGLELEYDRDGAKFNQTR